MVLEGSVVSSLGDLDTTKISAVVVSIRRPSSSFDAHQFITLQIGVNRREYMGGHFIVLRRITYLRVRSV